MIRERNGTLEVVVYVGRVAGKRRSLSKTVQGTGRAARKEAKTVEATLLAKAATERATASNVTVGQLLDRWLDFARVEKSTAYNDRLSLDKHVRPAIGDVLLSRLTASDLDAMYRKLEKGTKKQKPLAPSTVRRLHGRLRAALEQAKKWGWIVVNPALTATPPSEGNQDPESPPTEHVLALLGALDGELRCFVWLVAATGLRRGAACALRRSDLDLETGALRTRRALGMGKGAPYLKSTKTGASHALALGPTTLLALEELIAGQDATAESFGAKITDGYLFSHDDDCATPWRPDWPTKQIRELRESKPELGTVTLRALRHWMITQGLDSGASVKAVSGRASHARASTTLDRYAAWIPASDRALAESIEALLSPVTDE